MTDVDRTDRDTVSFFTVCHGVHVSRFLIYGYFCHPNQSVASEAFVSPTLFSVDVVAVVKAARSG